MADEKPTPEYHPRNEINDYVRRNYLELGNVKDKNIAIGVVGSMYRVMVKDAFHVLHTLKIDPKEIDADQAKARAEVLVAKATNRKMQRAKNQEHDRER